MHRNVFTSMIAIKNMNTLYKIKYFVGILANSLREKIIYAATLLAFEIGAGFKQFISRCNLFCIV